MPQLRITEQQFKELYGDGINYRIFVELPKSDDDFVENYLASKLWRLNNLYTIINKDGDKVPFVMNYAQHYVYAKSLKHSRLVILKSRQQGISTFWLISYSDDVYFMDNINAGMMAQGLKEAGTLLKRAKMAWREFPKEIKEFLSLTKDSDNATEISFNNDSTMYLQTSFRSATLQRLHISEFGKIAAKTPERAKETRTGTLQAIKPGNTVVIESTAEGNNDFKYIWDTSVEAMKKPQLAPKDFMPVFLPWINDPDCVSDVDEEIDSETADYFDELEAELGVKLTRQQKNFWIQQQRELGDHIYQEYPATPSEAFAKVKDGAYYSKLYLKHVVKKRREIKGLWDPNLEVYVVIDLGMNDTFVLVYFQRWRDEWRIIDEYHNSGEGLEHYVDHMFDTPYDIESVICPHDIKVRELGAYKGRSRYDTLVALGVTNIVVNKRAPIEDGIQAVRNLVPDLYIDPKCKYIINCLKEYTKEYDEANEVWKNKPVHNQWSHGADAVRGMAVSGITRKGGALHETNVEASVVDGLAL